MTARERSQTRHKSAQVFTEQRQSLPLIATSECFTFSGILESSPTNERRKLLQMHVSFVVRLQMQKCLHTVQKWPALAERAGPAECPLAAGIWLSLLGMMVSM